MSEPDATMTRIGQGMELSRRGECAAARELFAEVWDECGGQAGDPLHRCALAHAMADVQDDVQQELAWIKSGLGWLAERLASASRAEPNWGQKGL